MPPRVIASRASLHALEKKAATCCSFVTSPPQAPLTLSRPAAGAAHGVDDARASDLPDNANRDQLRAHALAGSTAVERAAVRRQAGVERSAGGRVHRS